MDAETTEGQQVEPAVIWERIARATFTSRAVPTATVIAKLIYDKMRSNYSDMYTETRVSVDRQTTEIHISQKRKDKNNGDETQQLSESEKPFVSDLETAKRNFIQSSIMAALAEAGIEPHSFHIEYFD